MTETRRLINATCPECRGPLTGLIEDGQLHEYVCLVGHRYSAATLLAAHYETQERTLWAGVVALEEATNLVAEVAPLFPSESAARLLEQAEKKRRQAEQVHGILQDLEPFRPV